METVSQKMQEKVLEDCLGSINSKEKKERKKEEKILLEKYSEVMKEMKDTVIKEVDLGIDEMVTKIDLINELFNEIEHTLGDLVTEPLGI